MIIATGWKKYIKIITREYGNRKKLEKSWKKYNQKEYRGWKKYVKLPTLIIFLLQTNRFSLNPPKNYSKKTEKTWQKIPPIPIPLLKVRKH